MSGPSKPETPESEKIQAKLAADMFDEGSKIKGEHHAKFMKNMQRNERASAISRSSADAAASDRQNLAAARSEGKFRTVDGGVVHRAAGVASSGKGGRDYTVEGGIAIAGVSSAERTARSMASVDHEKAMAKALGKNMRNQAITEGIVAGAQAYAYSDSNSKSKTNTSPNIGNHNAIDTQGGLTASQTGSYNIPGMTSMGSMGGGY